MTLGKLLNEQDEASYIRGKLKKDLGLSSRDVSVKTSSTSSVDVKIKTRKALAKKQEIEAIGSSQESYQTDDVTGEILSGGNTFVFVSIDYKFEDKIKDEIQREFEKQAKVTKVGDNVVLYGTFRVSEMRNGDKFVMLVKGGQNHAEIRDMNYVGTAVMQLIRQSKDDSLYAKIK